MSAPFAAHGALARGLFAVVVLVSLAVLFAPPSDVPPSPLGIDKLVHGSLFAALAFTARWAGVPRTAAVVLLVAYAAVSEVLQGTSLIGRDASVADWGADTVGVLVGVWVWSLVARPRRAR